jgi:hypothetical protein
MIVIIDLGYLVWRYTRGDLSHSNVKNFVAAESDKSSDEKITESQEQICGEHYGEKLFDLSLSQQYKIQEGSAVIDLETIEHEHNTQK